MRYPRLAPTAQMGGWGVAVGKEPGAKAPRLIWG
mgnify:CR=1 FL=1